MTDLDSILKGRDMTLPTSLYFQSYGFSIVMYGCESWTVKAKELMLLNCGVGEDP